MVASPPKPLPALTYVATLPFGPGDKRWGEHLSELLTDSCLQTDTRAAVGKTPDAKLLLGALV